MRFASARLSSNSSSSDKAAFEFAGRWAGRKGGGLRTVVVKLGSSTLTDVEGRFRLGPMAGRVAEVSRLQREGYRMLLVSSGAVSSGMGVLGLSGRPEEVVELQAASAVGQGRLYHMYSELFGYEGVTTAQVLLTAFDISARTQYLNARNTLEKLLEWRVVPIINENDTTSTEELCFGDNDTLAAQVALLVRADLLLLLTDTDGLYTANPALVPDARRIAEVRDFGELENLDLDSRGSLGRGGMRSKVRSAQMAVSGGVEVVIARGSRPGVVSAAVTGEDVGTRFPGKGQGLGAYKLWLLYGKPTRGRLVVDEGAARALRAGSSLLPVGIVRVEGTFAAGDAVAVVDPAERDLAKGIVSNSSEELDKVKGLRSGQVAELLPESSPEAIHRDYLVLVE